MKVVDSLGRRKEVPPPRKMEEGEDVSEYLEHFKMVMMAREVDKRWWSPTILPLLNSKTRVAVTSLSSAEQENSQRSLNVNYRG